MPPAIPLATYRLQLTKDFTFDDAANLAPYLKRLGITHLYASPFLKARPGSTHGYDIVDHEQLNPELGGDEGFSRLSAALKERDLGLIMDFVPNHMGVGHADNAWWLDVLEWGRRSPYAVAFDIDWDALPHRRHPGVLLPILGRPYGEALQNGEIALKYDADTGSFAAWYFDHKLPINPPRYSELLRTIVNTAGTAGEPAGRKLLELADQYRDPRTPSYRAACELKRSLATIPGAAEVIKRGLAAFRGDTETGAALLHRLLERQHYRLAYWRVALSAVNYRRFFDINDLAGLSVEHAATFRAIHGLVARLIAEARLQGLRLDHIDGLRDPVQYARRLSQLIRKVRRQTHQAGPFYVIVEKILADGEVMPRLAGVAGTTGYEWFNVISRLLVDGGGLDRLEATWREFTGERAEYSAMLDAAKTRIIETILASEFTVLSNALARIAAGHWSTRDFTADRLRAALQFYVLELPQYRTYVTAAGASPEDRKTIDGAIARARARWVRADPEIFDFLRNAVTGDLAGSTGYSAPRVRNFALKLQQFTGPLMAKSLEDTLFYRYFRLLALNEVGGDPSASGLSIFAFHERQQRRAETPPNGLTATATHDTKRGEDARVLSLSELAADWDGAVREWREMNARLLRRAGDRRCPSAAHEYMLYQTLIGAWPGASDDSFTERIQAFAGKAAREGKQESSWTNPNKDYESSLYDFIRDLLDADVSGEFLRSFSTFVARPALLGALNGLSQLAFKILLPGVPDFYQGTELWDLSLVDPDNRRPVDFAARDRALGCDESSMNELTKHWSDGFIKLALTRKLLHLRHEFADLFRQGTYDPMPVSGGGREHVIAFARRWKDDELVLAVGRHFAPLTDGGRRWLAGVEAKVDTDSNEVYEDLLGTLPQPRCSEIDLGMLMRSVPVAVLHRV